MLAAGLLEQWRYCPITALSRGNVRVLVYRLTYGLITLSSKWAKSLSAGNVKVTFKVTFKLSVETHLDFIDKVLDILEIQNNAISLVIYC